MLKKIIKNIALILDDEQVLNNLKDIEDNLESTIISSTQTYITLVNFVIANIAENFLCYNYTQDLVSDSEGKLLLSDLRNIPCYIRCIKDENFKNCKYSVGLDYIYVNNPNRVYYIDYAYIPDDLCNLTDTVLLPIGLDYKAVCYGVVSEYYALKMQYTEANIWEEKFKKCLSNLCRNYKGVRFDKGRIF